MEENCADDMSNTMGHDPLDDMFDTDVPIYVGGWSPGQDYVDGGSTPGKSNASTDPNDSDAHADAIAEDANEAVIP